MDWNRLELQSWWSVQSSAAASVDRCGTAESAHDGVTQPRKLQLFSGGAEWLQWQSGTATLQLSAQVQVVVTPLQDDLVHIMEWWSIEGWQEPSLQYSGRKSRRHNRGFSSARDCSYCSIVRIRWIENAVSYRRRQRFLRWRVSDARNKKWTGQIMNNGCLMRP